MSLRNFFLYLAMFISINLNSHIFQIDVLNDNVFLFYDMHITDNTIKNPLLLKEVYNEDPSDLPKGAYIGINHTQALAVIKGIKENFNLETNILTFENNLCDFDIYKNIISSQLSYFDSTAGFLNLSYFIAKFEKFPIVYNIEFRGPIGDLTFLNKSISSDKKFKEFLDLQPSKRENIIALLKQILNELLYSNKLIYSKIKHYFIPKLNQLIFKNNKSFDNESLLTLLQTTNLNKLSDICDELLDYRALNIILSNRDKNHFLFMGGWHCDNVKNILIDHCGYKLNMKKSYKEKNDNPINIKKYFDTFFPEKTTLKSAISKL